MSTKNPEAPVATGTPVPPPASSSKGAETKKVENSTDATQGEPLATRAYKRKAELEKLLAKTPVSEAALRSDIERSLSAIALLLTGDVKHLSDATGREINTWLESSKYLAEGKTNPRA